MEGPEDRDINGQTTTSSTLESQYDDQGLKGTYRITHKDIPRKLKSQRKNSRADKVISPSQLVQEENKDYNLERIVEENKPVAHRSCIKRERPIDKGSTKQRRHEEKYTFSRSVSNIDRSGKTGSLNAYSLLGPVLFKKLLYSGKLSPVNTPTKIKHTVSGNLSRNQSGEEQVDMDAITDHFSTKLSTQGQVATLKGYEDILEDVIHKEKRPPFQRKITPYFPTIPYSRAQKTEGPELDATNEPLNFHINMATSMLDRARKEDQVKQEKIKECLDSWSEEWRKEFKG